MNFNKLLQSLFGNKSSKDMKLIQPLVNKVKEAYPEIQKLSNDELRARTKQLQQYVQDSAKEQKEKIAELKARLKKLLSTSAKASSTLSTSSRKRRSTSTRRLLTRLCLLPSLS